MRAGVKSALVVGFYLLGLFTSLFIGPLSNIVVRAGTLLAGLVIAVTFSYKEYFKPAVKADRELLQELFGNVLFPRLRQIYRQELAQNFGEELSTDEIDEIADSLGINLMLYRHRDLFPWRNHRKLLPWQKSMQMDFRDGTYSEAEAELKWRKGEGCCGTALEERNLIYADLCNSNRDAWDLSSKQQEIANERLGSVLSIPIYRQREAQSESEAASERDAQVVGILNIDSEHCLKETKLDEKTIESALAKPAQYIGLFV